jgi:hypothetical protein
MKRRVGITLVAIGLFFVALMLKAIWDEPGEMKHE